MASEQQPRQVTHVSWKDRASGVLPMPGGYDGYLDSLRWLAKSVQEAPQTRSEIAERGGWGILNGTYHQGPSYTEYATNPCNL